MPDGFPGVRFPEPIAVQAGNDGGDVVRSAALIRQIDQRATGGHEIVVLRYRLGDLLRCYLAR